MNDAMADVHNAQYHIITINYEIPESSRVKEPPPNSETNSAKKCYLYYRSTPPLLVVQSSAGVMLGGFRFGWER